ncbi:MAG TPA: hypothetical protein VFZ32_17360 [Micromonosporaceae bacterium]
MRVRRCVLVLLDEPAWAPPGVERAAWRRALAEDAVDLLATLAEVDTGLAATPADADLAESVRWPDTPVVIVPRATPALALSAAYQLGYQQAAVLAGDAPDLPAMLIGKLLQPLGRRQVAAAPAGDALLGIAACLPVPDWLLAADPSLDATSLGRLRTAAGRPGEVAATLGWHRLRDPAGLARLDMGLEGWEATRTLLSAP